MADLHIEIAEYLASKSPEFSKAWECGCVDCEVITIKKIDEEYKKQSAGFKALAGVAL
jgi:hypothetical protein